jgi:threonine dehydrogenase-like Zn-dependent dehydrogenase
VLGHEAMGVVEEVGGSTGELGVGDRVVVPFQLTCGHCWMCSQGLYSQCETTQVREQGTGAALFGYSKLYGQVPGGQAQFLRVPQAQFTHVKVPQGPPDERFVYLSDVLPTSWQAVEYAAVPPGGSLVVLGLGPIGDMSCRIALHRGAGTVIGVDVVPERLQRAGARGVQVLDLRDHRRDLEEVVRDLTDGRGPDAVIDAVGMEAHGSAVTKVAHQMASMLPSAVAAPVMKKAGVDRLAALHTAMDLVRRGGTVSVSGVYGGMVDPMPMMQMFDKQVQVRMGQANVKRWTDQILPLLTDSDPLGVEGFATHRLPLEEAPAAYEMFQKKTDGCIKVVLSP